jgi:hypothetical protein
LGRFSPLVALMAILMRARVYLPNTRYCSSSSNTFAKITYSVTTTAAYPSNEACSAAPHVLRTTCQQLFGANLDLHELEDMISWIEHASISECECDDTCCEFCCVCANEFSFSEESDDEE